MCRHRLLFPESPEARVEVRELRIARPRQHRRVGNPLDFDLLNTCPRDIARRVLPDPLLLREAGRSGRRIEVHQRRAAFELSIIGMHVCHQGWTAEHPGGMPRGGKR
jgi:hypothetical protein